MKSLFFITFLTFAFSSQIISQSISKDCFEIKYLDFFGLDTSEKINWSEKDVEELLKKNYSEKFDETRFFIPILVRYLKDFHPACSKSIDETRFNNLVSIYFKVRLKDISAIQNKSIEEKLNYIRNDFYETVKDYESLPQMQFAFDDGPLYGEIPKEIPKVKPSESIVTDFGNLSILALNKRIFLVATDAKDKIIWSRIMKGTNPDRYLLDLKFDKTPVRKTSLATIINFHSEGEKLNVYLKPTGEFIYYNHSW